jgi:hypothetical protein
MKIEGKQMAEKDGIMEGAGTESAAAGTRECRSAYAKGREDGAKAEKKRMLDALCRMGMCAPARAALMGAVLKWGDGWQEARCPKALPGGRRGCLGGWLARLPGWPPARVPGAQGADGGPEIPECVLRRAGR